MKAQRIETTVFLIICAVTVLIIASCKKDFLEVPDNRVLTRQDLIKDLTTTEQFLNGIYTMLASDLYNYSNVIYPDLIADNIKHSFSNSFAFVRQYNWTQQANDETGFSLESTNVNGMSYSFYKIISACNFVLQKSQEYRSQNTSKADNMTGQALTIRALVHFWLVNVFAQPYNFSANGGHPGVPYLFEADYTKPVIRNSVAEVYNAMIKDLQDAIGLLPDNLNSKLFISRIFSQALLSRIYLFKEDYEASKNIARQVITKVPLMTVGYPEKLFTPDDVEAIFQLAPSYLTYSTTFSGLYFSTTYWQLFAASDDIANILQENPNDKRRSWVAQANGIWEITKFPDSVDQSYPYPAGSYSQTVIRSSELYLNAAESYLKLSTPNEDSARFYLDAIRQRADPSAAASTQTGQVLLDSIFKERRKELAFESLRMFDLLRWKKNVVRIDASDPSAKVLTYPSSKAIAPIPGLDVKVSGVSQNPGY